MRSELADMKAERKAEQDALVARELADQLAAVTAFTQNRAARLLQNYWRAFIKMKKKNAKATKGKGKGKK